MNPLRMGVNAFFANQHENKYMYLSQLHASELQHD
jgi:hypothetical protein